MPLPSSSVIGSLIVPPAGSESRGWVVVGRCHTGVTRPFLADVLAGLDRAGLGALVVPLGATDAPNMARRVALAASDLRDDVAGHRPIAFLGAGRGAAAGWLAAMDGDLDGVIGWNARPALAWSARRGSSVRSLLVVDGGGWWLPAARAAGWRLRGGADVVIPSTGRDVGVLIEWLEDRLLSGTPAVLPAPAASRRLLTPAGRVRLASVATVAAMAAGSMSASPAAATLPDFSVGSRLAGVQVGGDRPARQPTTTTTAAAGAKVLEAGDIKGDGPRGDPPLTDGLGVRWNVNTNIGFTTTSSASGAASEASFTHPVAASTLGGGSVNATLVDAFDGYNALCLDVNNVGGQCNTANMAVYNQNGPASLECSGRQVVLPLNTMGSFQVRRKVFVPANDGLARWLNIVRNTSAAPQTVRLVTSNNLGSDANTRIATTSDGDTAPELSDTWVTTFQNFSGTTSTDPRLGHVLRGVGAVVGLAAISFANGDDNPFWRYQFTLGPGQTAIIMNFATGQPTRVAAANQAAGLAGLTSPNALSCMTPAEISQVLNFRTDVTAPTCAVSGVLVGPPKQMQVTVQDTGSGLALAAVSNVQITNGTVAVAPFTAGTTSPVVVTATKTDPTKPTVWSFELTDVQGNKRLCK